MVSVSEGGALVAGTELRRLWMKVGVSYCSPVSEGYPVKWLLLKPKILGCGEALQKDTCLQHPVFL